MRRLTALIATVLLALTAPQALACSCPTPPSAEQAKDAEIVAQVRVDRIETAPADGEVFYTLTPLKVWKGDFDSSFLARTSDEASDCGMPNVRLRTELMLIANRTPDGVATLEACSGSGTYAPDIDEAVTAALGPGSAPTLDPAYPPGEIKMDGIEPNPMNIVLVGGTLLVLLGVVVGMLVAGFRRERRRGEQRS